MFSSKINKIWQETDVLLQETRSQPAGHLSPNLISSDLMAALQLLTVRPEIENDLFAEIIERSAELKRTEFNNSIFAIVPLYSTSICVEQCTYCNYRVGNVRLNVERTRLTDDELRQEATFLIKEKGLKVIELVYATDPRVRADEMCRQVEAVKTCLEKDGGGLVGINAEALEVDEYRRLRDAGLEFAVLWQETYDRDRYREVHPGKTKKTNYEFRLDAFERMYEAGIEHIGMGVLSGLADWRQEWAVLMQHEEYLKQNYGRPVSILGIPRLKPADGATLKNTSFIPSRDEFRLAIATHNIYSPETMAFVNTREDWDLCVDISAGGGVLFTFNCSTIPGGYSLGHRGYQFPTFSYDALTFGQAISSCNLKPIFAWDFNDIARMVEERQLAYTGA
jgi:2-iminoacetate synthase